MKRIVSSMGARLLFIGLQSLASSLLCAADGGAAQTETWPARPIRLIVSAAAASSIDIPARAIADKLRDRLGQPLVVDNRPQAGGIIAVEAAAKALPDGYTLLWSFNGPLANAPHLYARLSYDPQKDLAPVIMTTGQPFVLAVSPALGASSVREFITLARTSPGRYNYSSLGNGSGTHLTMELFKFETRVALVHVPYGGGPASAAALAAGEVQASFQVPALILPHVKTGKVRLLAVSTARRFALMPELPSVAEAGVPGFDSDSWNGIVAPAGTPRLIVQRLNREVNDILRLDEVKTLLAANLIRVEGGTPEHFSEVMRTTSQRWGAVIRQTGARVD
ncbi:MAG TPA: tripartite tricarboxylate transporter substrate-binding protein [Burkholderiales bacterium]|nr:tripartite tricarboxylate transporter substrate-binding protein [Burkholderiales bacterium]